MNRYGIIIPALSREVSLMENNENVEVVDNAMVPANNGKGMSIAALVCGILGIVGSFIPVVTYFTFILAILGIVFGAKGNKIAKETGEGKGMATAGLVLGIIGTAFGVLGILCVACSAALIGLGMAA